MQPTLSRTLRLNAADNVVPARSELAPGMTIQNEDPGGAGLTTREVIPAGHEVATAPIAGILMVGLGCEVNQIDFLLEAYGIERGPGFKVMNIQDGGGTRRMVEAGVAALRDMLPEAAKASRETVPASELVVALQCGGSDGYSGVTANPALGAAADLVVRHGGTVVLSETPEIYGAEHLLWSRSIAMPSRSPPRASCSWTRRATTHAR